MFERLSPALSAVGLKWDRSDMPYLYRLAPLQTLRNCSPLIDPAFVPAAKANHMRDDDDVIGLAIHGEARAYPWWILDNHHVANDTIAGRPVVVSLCEMCSSAVAFEAKVDERRLVFQTRYAYKGTNAFEDRQTKSLWAPYLGRAITGPLRGKSLNLLPAQQMQWGAWRARYPETLVLHGSLGSRTGHGAGHTMGSPALSADMKATVPRWDHRLTHNTLVLGVMSGNRQRAYPLDILREQAGVVNDEFDGAPIVILADLADGSAGALAFSRRLNGRTLTFIPDAGGPVDVETGSLWTHDGAAVAGPLEGARLRFVGSHVSEWFIWAAHFSEIELVLSAAPSLVESEPVSEPDRVS
jgi:hypothetical protein